MASVAVAAVGHLAVDIGTCCTMILRTECNAKTGRSDTTDRTDKVRPGQAGQIGQKQQDSQE